MKSPCMHCYTHGIEYDEEKCKDCEFKVAIDLLKKCRRDFTEPDKMFIHVSEINKLIH